MKIFAALAIFTTVILGCSANKPPLATVASVDLERYLGKWYEIALAKAELFRIPVFGPAMRGCGYISIDRTNRKSAFRSLEQAAKTIREGTSVIIFPEGTRSFDGKIKTFKKGGFVLTLNAGVPIVPLVISGTWSVMPRSDLRIRPGRVTLEILPPVDTSQYTRKNKELLMDRIRDLLCEHFEKLQGEKACN
jgi:1-acyl-sn-glycerol-3-phosphate acyltransferase